MLPSQISEWLTARAPAGCAARRLDADALTTVADMMSLVGVGFAAGVSRSWAEAAAKSTATRTGELRDLVRARIAAPRLPFADLSTEVLLEDAPWNRKRCAASGRYNLRSWEKPSEVRAALAREEALFPLVTSCRAADRPQAAAVQRLLLRLLDLLDAPVSIEHRVEAHPHDQRSVTSLIAHKAQLRVDLTVVV